MKKLHLTLLAAGMLLLPLAEGTKAMPSARRWQPAAVSKFFQPSASAPALAHLKGAMKNFSGNFSEVEIHRISTATGKERQRMQEFLMKDAVVASVPGIEALMQTLPGQCILFDLCRISGERGASDLTVLAVARRAFGKYAKLQSCFLDAYAALAGNGELLPEEKLANAAVAFRIAMNDGKIKYDENVRNLARALSGGVAGCSHSGILLAGFCKGVGLDIAFGYGYYSTAPEAPGHVIVALLNGSGISHILEPTTYLFGEIEFTNFRVADMIGMARVTLWSKRSELVDRYRGLESQMLKKGPEGIEEKLEAFKREIEAIDAMDAMLQNPKDIVNMEKGVFSWPMWRGINVGIYEGWKFEFLHYSEFPALYSGEPYSCFGAFAFGN